MTAARRRRACAPGLNGGTGGFGWPTVNRLLRVVAQCYVQPGRSYTRAGLCGSRAFRVRPSSTGDNAPAQLPLEPTHFEIQHQQ